MILLDSRVGSVDLDPLIRRLGCATRVTQLKFGDACFHGNGPGGAEYVIGVERKRTSDLFSSMRGHRLSGHQLPGLLETFHHTYLFIEGIFKPGPHGEMMVHRRGNWEPLYLGNRSCYYKEFSKHATSLEQCAGITVRRTSSAEETAVMLVNLHEWWEEKWESHRSVQAAYIKDATIPTRNRVSLVHKVPGIVWKMAAQLPGVDTKGEAVGKAFTTPLEMCLAKKEAWAKIAGIGPKLSSNIVELLQGKNKA